MCMLKELQEEKPETNGTTLSRSQSMSALGMSTRLHRIETQENLDLENYVSRHREFDNLYRPCNAINSFCQLMVIEFGEGRWAAPTYRARAWPCTHS